MGSALQDRKKTREGDKKNRKNRLETYSTIFLDSTGKEYARIEWVPPLKGAQPRISGFCFFAMIDWIPSEGRNPFRMRSAPQKSEGHRQVPVGAWPATRKDQFLMNGQFPCKKSHVKGVVFSVFSLGMTPMVPNGPG